MATQARSIPTTIYHGYRILLILLLLGLALAAQYGYVPDQNLPRPFLLVCASYLPLAVLIPMLPARLLLIGFIIDVAATILMIHTSGGLAGSLAVLLLVVVASANILLPLRLGLLVASLATLAIIGEQAWLSLRDDPHVNFTIVGLLGLAFFATSLLVQQLALRLNRSEALGEQQRRAIAQLEELNRQIVSRLRTGILVFDQQLRILTANPAAQLLFDEPLAGRPLPVPLTEAYSVWRDQPWSSRPSLKLSPQMPPMLARFAHLHEDEDDTSLTVLFLEDEARLTQEAQHLKLAALGRISAIIAHEIRNPLSAIQHATDLLAEESETDATRPLFNIVRNHVKRVNGIISGILDLSRRQPGNSERLNLAEQVRQALEHLQQQGIDCRTVTIEPMDASLQVRFVESQLQQLVQNLVTNALRHGGEGVAVTLSIGTHSRSRLPWLKISDNGKGFSEEVRAHLFEPFFTTAKNGTGLGLFLCRELCEANQAQLELENPPPGETRPGASFVITFAHSDRLFQ